MKKTNLVISLVFVLVLTVFCVPTYAATETGVVTYSAPVITDVAVLEERAKAGINEYDGEELVVEGGAKYVLQTADAPVVQQVTLPTTTQLLRTTEYADGKVTKDYATAVQATTKSASGHSESNTLNVWAIVYWSQQIDPDPGTPCMIYKFNKSEHFYSESGDGAVTKLEAENYVGYNEYDIVDASSVQYSPVDGRRYSLTNPYTAWIAGGQGGHYEAYTYVTSERYGRVEAFVRYYTPAA